MQIMSDEPTRSLRRVSILRGGVLFGTANRRVVTHLIRYQDMHQVHPITMIDHIHLRKFSITPEKCWLEDTPLLFKWSPLYPFLFK